MNNQAHRGGVILAGGRSRRFGNEDKALASLQSKPLIAHVVDRLDPAVSELVINCRSEQQARITDALAPSSIDVIMAPDPNPDRGPLAGIKTGLTALENVDTAFVTACDMPLIEPELIEFLFAGLTEAEAVVPRLDDEWLQTTHAVYRCESMIDACDATLAEGDGRIVSAIDRLNVRIIEVERIRQYGSLDSFFNINTNEDLEAAECKLSDSD